MSELLDYILIMLPTTALGALRALGILAILPMGGIAQFASLRLAMAVGLSLLCLDVGAPPQEFSVAGGVAELLYGICLGLPAALTLSMIAMSAELHETVRGQTMGSILDPIASQAGAQQEPTLAALLRSLIWALVLAGGLGELIVARYAESMATFPAGSLHAAVVSDIFVYIARATLQSLEFCLVLVLPFLIVAILVELAFAFLSKVSLRMSLTHEVFVLKSFLMMAVLSISWQFGLMESLFQMSEPVVPGQHAGLTQWVGGESIGERN